jgi:phosphate-selective porin OprO/OprP
MRKEKTRKGILLIAGIVILCCWGSVVQAGSSELAEMKQKLTDLESRMAHLEEKQNTESSPTDFRVFWKEGLNFDSQDGSFKLKIGGRLQTDWFWSSEDDSIKSNVGEQEDGVEFRRARIYFSGLIYDNVEYKLQLDFEGGDADFKDAYLALTDFPLGTLQMGHFKEPFSLDELTSSKYITFLERALPNVFAPSRNTGFMLHNVAFNERITAAIGVFRDTDDYGENVDDGGYNVTGRVTALPIYKDKGASLLHIGVGYSYRNPDDSLQYRQRPEAHLADYFVDTGSFTSDQADLLGLEAAWVNGPFSMQSEYIKANASRIGGSDVSFDGYYVQAGYFLTGEHRSYKTSEAAFSRTKPKKNYSSPSRDGQAHGGGCGAWEVKARYSELDLNDGGITGGELDNITAGLNWYLNPNTKIMWDYVHTDKDTVGQADIFMMRLQFDF